MGTSNSSGTRTTSEPCAGFPQGAGIRDILRAIRRQDRRTLGEQVELARIPAPPFGEGARAERMVRLFRRAGFPSAGISDIGNVVAVLPARLPNRSEVAAGGSSPAAGRTVMAAAPSQQRGESASRRPLVVSAHLDTVFPTGTPIHIRKEGSRWVGPGILDDARGLAALLTVARTLRDLPAPRPIPIVFAATVGEEGEGDLRGVRCLLSPGGQGADARGFITLDGPGVDGVVARGVGSVRLRVAVHGPGGHSWSDRHRASPTLTLARAAQRAEQELRRSEASINLGRWGGGTGVNVVPETAWVELEIRSACGATLARNAARLEQILHEEVLRSGSGLRLEVVSLGRRPAGATDPSALLLRAALEATRAVGGAARTMAASTDANHPMSQGVPAIAMGAGGRGDGAHSLNEWYDNRGGPRGILRACLTVLRWGQLEAGGDR